MDLQQLTNSALMTYILVLTIAIARVKNLFTTTALCSIFTLLMASIYFNMGALDVAATEAAVGSGVSTIFILNALSITGTKEKKKTSHNNFATVITAITAMVLFTTIKDIPTFSNPDNPIHNYVSHYYIEMTIYKMKIKNSVTAILASIRGYDTMCETCVVMTAALCVMFIMGTDHEKQRK